MNQQVKDSVIVSSTDKLLKRNKSASIKPKRNTKRIKVTGYNDNQYSNNNLYGNEYSGSAQNSQFTFGATPESGMSDRGLSATNSANKSVSKDNVAMHNMRDIIKKNKLKAKHRQSNASDK